MLLISLMKHISLIILLGIFISSCKKDCIDEPQCLGVYNNRDVSQLYVDTNAQSTHLGDTVMHWGLNQESMIYPDSCLENNCSTIIKIYNSSTDTINVKYTANFADSSGQVLWSTVDSMIISPGWMRVEDEKVNYNCANILLGTFTISPVKITYF